MSTAQLDVFARGRQKLSAAWKSAEAGERNKALDQLNSALDDFKLLPVTDRLALYGASSVFTVGGYLFLEDGQLEKAAKYLHEASRLTADFLNQDCVQWDKMYNETPQLAGLDEQLKVMFQLLDKLEDKRGNRASMVIYQLRQAMVMVARKQTVDAGPAVSLAVKLASAGDPRTPEIVRQLIDLCIVFSSCGDFPGAVTAAEQALRVSEAASPRTLGLSGDEARARFLIGQAQFNAREFAKAEVAFGKSADAYAAISGGEMDAVSALQGRALALLAVDEMGEALRVVERQIKLLAGESSPPAAVARVYGNKAILLRDLGRARDAEEAAEQAARIAREHRLPPADLVQYHVNLAEIETLLGNHQAALSALTNAEVATSAIPANALFVSQICSSQAGVLEKLNRIPDAQIALERSVNVLRQAGIESDMRTVREVELALFEFNYLGRSESLQRVCGTGVKLHPKSFDEACAFVAGLSCLSIASAKAGDATRAIAYSRAILDLLTQQERHSDPPTVHRLREIRVTALRNLGSIQVMSGDVVAGVGSYRQVVKMRLEELGKELTAHAGADKMIRVSKFNAEPSAQILISLAFLERMNTSYESWNVAALVKGLYANIVSAERSRIFPNGARTSLGEQGTNYLEHRSRYATARLLFQDDETLTAQFDSLTADLRREASAFGAHLRGVYADALVTPSMEKVSRILSKDEVLIDYVVYWRFSPKNVLEFGDELRYGAFVARGTSSVVAIDLGSVKAIDAAILNYRREFDQQIATARFDEMTLAMLAEKIRRLLLDPITERVGQARRYYVSPTGQITLMPFEALPVSSTTKPARYLVEDAEVVTIASSRQLIEWAVDAPKAGRVLGGGSNSASNTYTAVLIGDPTFEAERPVESAAQAFSIDRPTQAAAPEQRPVLLSPDEPTAPRNSQIWKPWSSLPATGEFVRNLGKTLRDAGLNVRVCTNGQASETSIARMGSPAIFVVASHGRFVETEPRVTFHVGRMTINSEAGMEMHGVDDRAIVDQTDPLLFSMVVLAGASANPNEVSNRLMKSRSGYFDDGLLTGFEVAALDLRFTELVILAGCETGVGATAWYDVEKPRLGTMKLGMVAGENVVGLRQAFRIAGAQSLIMSVWRVPLEETIALFQQFFQNWTNGGMPRYCAFRSAQISTLKRARARRNNGHPLWWAGFIYEGEPGAARKGP